MKLAESNEGDIIVFIFLLLLLVRIAHLKLTILHHGMIGIGYLLDEVDGLSRRSHFLWCKNLLHRRESFCLNEYYLLFVDFRTGLS